MQQFQGTTIGGIVGLSSMILAVSIPHSLASILVLRREEGSACCAGAGPGLSVGNDVGIDDVDLDRENEHFVAGVGAA